MKKLIVFSVLVFLIYAVWDVSSAYMDTQAPVVYISPTPRPLDAEYLWKIVNDYRLSKNLQPFEKDERLCDIAEERVPEVSEEEVPHEGLLAKYSNNSYYLSENISLYYPNEQSALQGWLGSPPHRNAIEGTYTHSCIACDKDIACVQIFSSFDNQNHSKL